MSDAKLETLLTVYETGSFTKAAERLSLTQPAVSHHIRQLEQELGVHLFLRGEGGIKPTSEGETVLKYASRIQSLYRGMRQELSDRKQHVTRLTVGITHTAESNPIAEVLAKYGSEHNNVHITMISDNITNLMRSSKPMSWILLLLKGVFRRRALIRCCWTLTVWFSWSPTAIVWQKRQWSQSTN